MSIVPVLGTFIIFTLSPVARNVSLWLVLFLLLSAPVFYLFTYNSGFGYDQLEYLVIGRSIAEGFRFYTWLPSKSFGLYALIAGLYSLGVNFGHISLALVITGVYVLMTLTTFLVARASAGGSAAPVAAALVALCAFFMELNFLQPTGFVYLFGLLAFSATIAAMRRRPVWHLFLAGLALASGAHFKSISGFYGAAIILFVLWTAWRSGRFEQCVTTWLPALVVGCALGFAGPVIYFAATDRLTEFWRWTVTFPLLDYPANTYYLNKLYTKLLFIHLLIVFGLALSLHLRLRREIYAGGPALLALLMGVISYAQVLKTQSSHYSFPGAAFLMIFVAIVLTKMASLSPLTPARVGAIAFVVVAFIGLAFVSGYLYRPEAFERLMRLPLKDFSGEETTLREFVHRKVPAGKRMLIFRNSTKLYWVGHRYPPPPFINTDEKTVWYFRHHPEVVLATLDDRDLVLVEFNPEQPEMEDLGFSGQSGDLKLWQQFHSKLQQGYARINEGPERYVFWIRK